MTLQRVFLVSILSVASGFSSLTHAATNPSEQSVLKHYADIAQAGYSDSLATAKLLENAVNQLVVKPTTKNLNLARQAWVASRVPYQQTEVFRFGNPIVDDWEGKVNAWPLDEGLIDYVATSYGEASDANNLYSANIIANKELLLSGNTIDISDITPALLSDTLHEVDDVEANVVTGYHAIEFLLWGQDLNGTNAGAGNRPVSDFDTVNCTGGNCDRRIQFLQTAVQLLITDLEWMSNQWGATGEARANIENNDSSAGLAVILTGMGSLSYGELAGERMKLGLILHDPEEEHDCFSDNTHYSHYYDALGIQNVYTGRYLRTNGKLLEGPSIADLVLAKNPEADNMLLSKLDSTMSKMQILVDTAINGEAYDQMIGSGNTVGNAKVQAAISALTEQTKAIGAAAVVLGLNSLDIEGSDSLDSPQSIQ
ncbi:MAG: putative iron-regulated protein [Candidatus Azotimanducaceae bacterium]|jgi:putative iron-regulated protein